jgi:hypothetical protein
VPALVIALVLCGTALAAVLRTEMRGVIVGPDGVEIRELLPLGIPRVRRLLWSQIDKARIPRFASDGRLDGKLAGVPTKIRLDLWDGTQTLVPEVARTRDLALILERVALARAIPIEGGTGLLDDLGAPFDGEESGTSEAA